MLRTLHRTQHHNTINTFCARSDVLICLGDPVSLLTRTLWQVATFGSFIGASSPHKNLRIRSKQQEVTCASGHIQCMHVDQPHLKQWAKLRTPCLSEPGYTNEPPAVRPRRRKQKPKQGPCKCTLPLPPPLTLIPAKVARNVFGLTAMRFQPFCKLSFKLENNLVCFSAVMLPNFSPHAAYVH